MNIIGNIISSYRKKAHLSQPELAALLQQEGINANAKAMSKWETGAALPNINVFLHICRLLGVKNIYEEYFGSDRYNRLSELNEEGKSKAMDYIDLLIASGRYNKSAPDKIISFPVTHVKLYDLPVSAGMGEFLEDEHFTIIDVEHPIPEGTDFAVRINGDSMEPMFVTNQIVWIHKQDELENGEIGIFFLDGNAYCKKYRKTENGIFLISLNSSYSPIELKKNSVFKIFGKVLG